MSDRTIHIVLINYNNAADTLACLDSISQQKGKIHTWIVDNASTDNSLERIHIYIANHSHLPISLIPSDKNIGFAAGNNLAIRKIHELSETQDLVLILNNDTLLPNDFIEKMSSEYDRLATNGLVALACQERSYYTHRINHSGKQYIDLLTGLSMSCPIGFNHPYLCGACMMIGAEAPLFDESYFLYYDDVAYCDKLQDMGYRLCSTNVTFYYHKVQGTTRKVTTLETIYFHSMFHYFRTKYPKFMPVAKCLRILLNLCKLRFATIRTILQTYQAEIQQ